MSDLIGNFRSEHRSSWLNRIQTDNDTGDQKLKWVRKQSARYIEVQRSGI